MRGGVSISPLAAHDLQRQVVTGQAVAPVLRGTPSPPPRLIRRNGRAYKVRQVTDIQASWTERERGQRGTFTLQLILDSGVEEYILDPDADDLDVLIKLFARSGHTTFDLERKVLMFSNLSVE